MVEEGNIQQIEAFKVERTIYQCNEHGWSVVVGSLPVWFMHYENEDEENRNSRIRKQYGNIEIQSMKHCRFFHKCGQCCKCKKPY